jgi:hypothetical protein
MILNGCQMHGLKLQIVKDVYYKYKHRSRTSKIIRIDGTLLSCFLQG